MLEKELASKRFEIKHKRTVKFDKNIDEVSDYKESSPRFDLSLTKYGEEEKEKSFHGRMKIEVKESEIKNKVEELSDSFYFRDDENDERDEDNEQEHNNSHESNEDFNKPTTFDVPVTQLINNQTILEPKRKFQDGLSSFLQKVVKVISRGSS